MSVDKVELLSLSFIVQFIPHVGFRRMQEEKRLSK